MERDIQPVVIVGQAPNERCWRRELAYGESLMARMEGGKGAMPPLEFAERCCARLAITGTVGKRLAGLLGVSFPRPFISRFDRVNLNARWTGKRNCCPRSRRAGASTDWHKEPL